jgi:hypothetical protein
MKKGILRTLEDGRLSFYCPGCREYHTINTISTNSGPCWGFNGNYEKPTFTPSVLVKSGHYCDHAKPGYCWCNYKERFPDEGEPPFKCGICHSFVTDGRIQFLSDCTHELAGKTVELECPE